MTPDEPAIPHVLVVDDEPLILETTCEILESAGISTRAADSAEAAMSLLDEHTQLVLTDTAMGGMSGAELRARLRQARPGIPVLLMSGMDASELPAWGVAPGDGPFLPKPFSADQLLSQVRAMITR